MTRQSILVPVALAERAVVVRAAVLDRVQLAAAVVDADEEHPRRTIFDEPGGNSSAGSDLDLGHA